jgi:hypothetical protein
MKNLSSDLRFHGEKGFRLRMVGIVCEDFKHTFGTISFGCEQCWRGLPSPAGYWNVSRRGSFR